MCGVTKSYQISAPSSSTPSLWRNAAREAEFESDFSRDVTHEHTLNYTLSYNARDPREDSTVLGDAGDGEFLKALKSLNSALTFSNQFPLLNSHAQPQQSNSSQAANKSREVMVKLEACFSEEGCEEVYRDTSKRAYAYWMVHAYCRFL